MASPSELVSLLLSRPPTLGAGRLLCLDGPAGSGKTTLAAAVAELLPDPVPGTVIHLDDLYDGWHGLSRLHEQLDPLLLPLARGETGSYRRYDWVAGRYAETVAVAPAPVLILEGVGSGLAAYSALRTLLVWVDADRATRLARWRARDGAAVEPFIADWQRDEAALFAREGTRDAADVVWADSVPPMVSPSGEQYEISAGGYAATVTESGATLRLLSKEGRALVDGFGEDAMAAACRGQLLMPWPNRIRDGRYTFAGATQQLPLSEPARHNASHGLARWASWHVVDRSAERVELGLRLAAQSGYPWTLDLGVVYELGADGLTVTQRATNVSDSPAPYASGAHPYLTLDTGEPVDAWTLQAPAATRILSDPERKLPTGSEPVEGTAYDFRTARPIGETSLDTCFTDLARDDAGIATVVLSAGGRAVELWLDDAHGWLMLYTADDRTPPRRSIAVEPMTAAVDAFNSGQGLVTLRPGETFSARWGLRGR